MDEKYISKKPTYADLFYENDTWTRCSLAIGAESNKEIKMFFTVSVLKYLENKNELTEAEEYVFKRLKSEVATDVLSMQESLIDAYSFIFNVMDYEGFANLINKIDPSKDLNELIDINIEPFKDYKLIELDSNKKDVYNGYSEPIFEDKNLLEYYNHKKDDLISHLCSLSIKRNMPEEKKQELEEFKNKFKESQNSEEPPVFI